MKHSLIAIAILGASSTVFAADTDIDDLTFAVTNSISASGSYSAGDDGANFILSGTISGDVEITSSGACRVTLSDGLTMSGTISIAGDAALCAAGGSVVASGASAVSCTGSLVLCGSGAATYSGGAAKTGVISADSVVVKSGTHNVNMTFTEKKNGYGIYVGTEYSQLSGIVKIVSSCTEYKDVGITGPKKSTCEVAGGILSITMPGPKSCGINMDKASCTTTISGGEAIFNMTGDAAKGVKSDGAFVMTGGLLDATITGDALIETYEGEDEDGNTLYYTCTVGSSSIVKAGTYLVQDSSKAYGVKCDSVDISGGTVRIVASGVAGRGIGADTTLDVSGGLVDITVEGDASDYLITFDDDNCVTSCLDRTTACCIKQGSGSGFATITGGTMYLSATGTAGKCVSVDGSLVVGTSGQSTLPTDASFAPDIQCTTYGAKIYVSAQKLKNYYNLGTVASTTTDPSDSVTTVTSSHVTSGSGDNVDYSNPKCVKAETDVKMYGGRLRIYSKCDGGEGFESKGDMLIAGGIVEGACYDDVINTAGDLSITGGYLYCGSTGNDAIDSNSGINVSGGVVLAFTTTNPETGIDLDNASDFKVTGGVILSCGSATNMAVAPKSSGTTQSYYLSTSLSASTYAGKYVTIAGSGVTVKIPSMSSTSGSISLLCTAPSCTGKISVGSSAPSGGSIGFHGVYQN